MNSISDYSYLLNVRASSITQALSQNLFELSQTRALYVFDSQCLFMNYLETVLKKKKVHYSKIQNFNSPPAEKNHLILLPKFEFRIFNFNFNRVLKQEFGEPYFVFTDSNKSQLIEKKLQQQGFLVAADLFKLFPEVLKAYLCSPELLNWLKQKSCTEPHNDLFDRNYFLKLNQEISSEKLEVDLYKNNFKEEDFFNLNELKRSSFPAHRFYQKYLNVKLSINQLEQEIYGTVV